MKKIYQLLVLVVLSIGLNSCYEDRPYYEPFLGTWESVSYVENDYEYPLRHGEWHRYIFYSDGTGYYEQEDGLRTRFYWDEYSGHRLELRHSDGLNEYLYYDFDRRYLLLSTHSNFRTYFVYEPRF